MNEVLKNLARLKDETMGEPQGVDTLYLNAVHVRAFMYALDATEKKSFENSYLRKIIVSGATYSIVLNIMKLYDRPNPKYQMNNYHHPVIQRPK